MKKLTAMLLTSAVAFAAVPASAADFSFQGNLGDPNEVQLFNFNVPVNSIVTLRTYSYAGGTNAAGDVIARGGFDPILALFNSLGVLIDQNDDGVGVPFDPVTNRAYDTLLSTNLGPGNYTVSVMAFSNFANGPNLSDGFQNSGSFVDVTGNQRTSAWAFDILNVGTATQVGGVPEPSTWAMMLLGFAGIGFAMRRGRPKQKLSVTYA